MSDTNEGSWTRGLTTYHWLVFCVATAAWFFDCLDQRLFSLARVQALTTLAGPGTDPGQVQMMAKWVTALFLVGWGIGGIVFGAMGDRYGRARMLTVTVLLYSVFTGLSFFSQSIADFAVARFMTGIGVGGVFGLAVSLIAETLPARSRAGALGMLQLLTTVGNVAAGLFKQGIDYLEAAGTISPGEGWRWLFLIGALPALLVLVIRNSIHEPEPWLRAKAAGTLPTGSLLAPYAGLLADRHWRKNLLVGSLLASTGVIGLWGIGEYAIDLQTLVFKAHFEAAGVAPEAIPLRVNSAKNFAYILQMLGAAVGMWVFTKFAISTGRKFAFAIGYTLAGVVTALAYWKMQSPLDAYWMMPLMGAAQFALFAGFAIYLPELFPSRLRSTGVSFCYNLGRFAAAAGSLFSAQLAIGLYGGYGSPLKERYAALTMCAIFLVGLATLPFAPETKDKPLPE